jgi:hypothetical protein
VAAVAAERVDLLAGTTVVTVRATLEALFATAIAVATEKNDVTLSPARTMRVVAAGWRRRVVLGWVAASLVPAAFAVGDTLDRPDAARRSCSRRKRSA